ncbi:DUF2809 domain-containing protein [Mycetocola miduiensis]|uniref:DUF2809 domain-containing protein n=1 Tax=Mycetocola miduiensis TaxID=995034 RepID=A0A1I5DPB2_9MICO|nr:DUF2809 domain-containing protein [Mycetocola miduiensis]SFO00631.1 Protein of unknown function [Mycetocola miduiensis]
MRTRSRGVLLAVCVPIVAVGLLLRTVPGVAGDAAGGILYATLLFALIALVMPAAPSVRIGAIAFGICVVVEMLQLTGIPTAAARLVPPTRYVLGTTFVASDLIAYAAGTLCAVLIDHLARRLIARRAVSRQPKAQ